MAKKSNWKKFKKRFSKQESQELFKAGQDKVDELKRGPVMPYAESFEGATVHMVVGKARDNQAAVPATSAKLGQLSEVPLEAAEVKSGAKCVYPYMDGRWRVQCRYKGKSYHVGIFNTVEDAVVARDVFMARLKGQESQ